jgi:hypothetical protein
MVEEVEQLAAWRVPAQVRSRWTVRVPRHTFPPAAASRIRQIHAPPRADAGGRRGAIISESRSPVHRHHFSQPPPHPRLAIASPSPHPRLTLASPSPRREAFLGRCACQARAFVRARCQWTPPTLIHGSTVLPPARPTCLCHWRPTLQRNGRLRQKRSESPPRRWLRTIIYNTLTESIGLARPTLRFLRH